MSEERGISGDNVIEEDADVGREEHPTGCFQVSGLCCCIPARRMYLPGRRPKDRKKKNGEKNTAVDPSLNDTKFEERQPNRAQDYWNMTSAGDLGTVQTEAIKPILTLPTQPYNTTTQDLHIPVALGDICLEGKKEYDEKINTETSHTQSKARQQKEVLDNWSFYAETEKKCLVGNISEETPLGEEKDCLVMPPKTPELLGSLLQKVAHEKKQSEGEDNASILLEGTPYKKELKQDLQDLPLQELQQSRELMRLATNGKKLQEEQNSTTDFEGGPTLEELHSQPSVQCNEELQAWEHEEIVLGVTCNTEKQQAWGQMNFASQGDGQKEGYQDYQDRTHKEAQQSVELKYPDILSTMCGNYKEEQPGVQLHPDFVMEDSSNNIEHTYLNLQENQPPVIPKALSFSFQGSAYEKKWEDAQAIRSAISEVILRVEDHLYVPHPVDQQAVAPENAAPLALEGMCTMDLHELTTSLPSGVSVHTIGQKHPENQQLLLLEQVSTHQSIREEKEQQEGRPYAYFESKGTAYTEEQESQQPVVSEDNSPLPEMISYEKEQQRELACGDSGPEGFYDKEDQTLQSTLYLDVQQPLVLGTLGSLSLNGTFEEEQRARKENPDAGNLEINSLGKESEEQDNPCNMHTLASSKEKEVTEEQEQQPPVSLLVGGNKQGEQVESRHIQTAPLVPYEVPQPREQLSLGMTCEESQKKENPGLSNTTFPCNMREDSGHV